MSIALYRKYRPKTFSEVTGQQHIKVTLQNEIESDRVAHAYLFCGPRGTGKTTLARLLSKSVNCLDLQPSGEPCNKCASCEEIIGGRALDIIEIDAASHTGVDNIRENIIHNARFTPSKSKSKVFIIDEVHMLSISAFNALLKILEEPPKYVIFILATTEAHKVPATIISRCQRFDFKKIVLPELVDRLRWISLEEGMSVEEQVLKLVAMQSGGCVRDAESLLEQIFSLGEKTISLDQAELILPKADFDRLIKFFEMIIKKKTPDAIGLINGLVSDGFDLSRFTDNFIEFTRQAMLYKITKNPDELARDFEESIARRIIEAVSEISERDLVNIIEKFLSARELFKQTYIAQLPLEIAVVQLTSAIPVFQPRPMPISQPVVRAPEQKIQEKTNIEPVKKTEETNESAPVPAVESLPGADLSEINSAWPRVLEKIKTDNYSLYMSLKMGNPIHLADNVLTIGFLFEIQRKRVNEVKGKSMLCEAIKEVFGKNLIVETRVESAMSLPQNQKEIPAETIADPVDEIANAFGGTIVAGAKS
ncbi:DNA polymerase III subunit gamma/tau [Patescibacteria group bacterium]|nr:DNA polymerase III subunit gamma/tau [Patescibacteria group bacterium]